LKAAGWDIDIQAHVRRGGRVLGLCAGYQILGKQISDPHGVEGGGSAEGLGLLDVSTVLAPAKTLGLQEGFALGEAVHGYEMHMGRTIGPDAERPFVTFANGDTDGANDVTGKIAGTYLHGLFAADRFRSAFLARLGATSTANYDAEVDQVLNALADHLEAHLDLDALLTVAQPCSAST